MKIKLTLLIASLLSAASYGQSIIKSSIDSGGVSASAGNIQVLYTIGEVAVQETTVGDISISEGFIHSTLKIIINPLVFLQGPYNSPASMLDNLRVSGFIPLNTPYTDGASTTQDVLDVTGNNAIVDWVWIELRDKDDNTSVLHSTSALLQRDGNIVSTDGVSSLSFSLNQDTYYLSIAHYNHLGIITANPIALASNSTIDLTTDTTIINGGVNAFTNMMDGYYAMSGGDFDGNGQIQNTDRTGILPLIGNSTYSPADIDMNGQIQNTDINNVLLPNIGKGEQLGKTGTTKDKTLVIVAPRKNN